MSDLTAEAARGWLRLTTEAYDDEITETIGACVRDLANAGAAPVDQENPLVRQAIRFYLRAHFGYADEKDQARYNAAYEHLKAALALSSNNDDTGDAG